MRGFSCYYEKMRTVLYFGIILAFALGIGLQTVFDISSEIPLLILLISFAVSVIWRRNHTVASAPYLLLCSVLLCSFAVGLLRTEVASWQFGDSVLQTQIGEQVTFVGTVISEPKKNANTTQLHVSDSIDTILVSTDRHTLAEYGDEIQVNGKLTVPESFTTDLGRTFDYPGYLKAKGIEYTMSFAGVERLSEGEGNIVISTLLKAKYSFMTHLERVISEPEVGLGEGLLLGVKQALGEDIEMDFRRTGIIHIVVLSGYNVMLVVAFFMFILARLLSPRTRVVVGVVAIVAFALLVGLSATVVRASIMASLLLLAQGFGRQYDVMRALFFAGAIMLIINPYILVYDIGFQLSFMATLGLLMITPHFESSLITGPKGLQLKDFFLATLSTQIAVLPLLLYHIGEVSIVSVLVNVLVLPVVPVAMLLTFLTGLMAFVSLPIASLFGFVASLSLSYILLIAQWFSRVPFAAVSIPEFSAVGVFTLYGLLAGILCIAHKRTPKKLLSDWEVELETDGEVQKKDTSYKKEVSDCEDKSLPKIFR
jgi:competence protein ComEC